jgi:flagellin-like protein
LGNERKAISNIVAVLMLIMISLSGGVLLYTYAAGLMGPLQGAQPQQSYLEHVALEYYDWTNLQLQIRIRNVGNRNIQISDVFISGTIVSSLTWDLSNCPGGSLPVQSSCLIQITPPSALTLESGVAYPVSFVSSTGSKTSFSVVYGQTG